MSVMPSARCITPPMQATPPRRMGPPSLWCPCDSRVYVCLCKRSPSSPLNPSGHARMSCASSLQTAALCCTCLLSCFRVSLAIRGACACVGVCTGVLPVSACVWMSVCACFTHDCTHAPRAGPPCRQPHRAARALRAPSPPQRDGAAAAGAGLQGGHLLRAAGHRGAGVPCGGGQVGVLAAAGKAAALVEGTPMHCARSAQTGSSRVLGAQAGAVRIIRCAQTNACLVITTRASSCKHAP